MSVTMRVPTPVCFGVTHPHLCPQVVSLRRYVCPPHAEHPHNIQAIHVVRSLRHRHERATPPGRERRAGPRAMSSADGDAGRAAPIGAPAQPPAQPTTQASHPFPPLPPPLCPVTAALLAGRPGMQWQREALFAQMLLLEGAQATDPLGLESTSLLQPSTPCSPIPSRPCASAFVPHAQLQWCLCSCVWRKWKCIIV